MIEDKINIPKRLLEGILKRIDCYRIFQDYRTVRMKILKVQKRIKFLAKCFSYRLIPNFLRFKIPNNGAFAETAVHNFQRRLLKLEINNAHSYCDSLNDQLSQCRSKVQCEIPEIFGNTS